MSTGNMDGMTLNGVVLLGQALDMSGTAGNDNRYVNELPTLAATACYHHKVSASCTAQTQVEEARKFGSDIYIRALYAGHTLPTSERDAVADRLASLTGLPSSFVRDHDLRISTSDFAHTLLADRHEELGTYDGRYILPSGNSGKDPVADDPAMGQYVPGFVAAYNLYARGELGVSSSVCRLMTPTRPSHSGRSMRTGTGVMVPASVRRTTTRRILQSPMRRNPQLRLMVGAGYYDLQTPLGTADYTLSHSGIPAVATQVHLYASGHMPYLGDESRQALARDLRAFLAGATGPVKAEAIAH